MGREPSINLILKILAQESDLPWKWKESRNFVENNHIE
jgi:hypothetical protein